jgi:hypothetical protein
MLVRLLEDRIPAKLSLRCRIGRNTAPPSASSEGAVDGENTRIALTRG